MTNLLCAVALALPAVAVAAPPGRNAPMAPTQKLSDLDTQMIAHQHAVNQTEIKLGKLAESNGTSAVRKYGAMLVKDHSQADRNITSLAHKKGVETIPKDAALTESDERDLAAQEAKLETMKGASFDRVFLDMMVTGHEREVTKITADIAVVTDRELRAMLQKIKPVLQHHEDAAKALQKTLTSQLEH